MPWTCHELIPRSHSSQCPLRYRYGMAAPKSSTAVRHRKTATARPRHQKIVCDQKKSIPGILFFGCDHAVDAVGVPWSCREHCECFSMPYSISVASPLGHGCASGPKFGQMVQTYLGDTVEGVIDLWDRGIKVQGGNKYSPWH